MSSGKIPGLSLGNPFDAQLRDRVERRLSEISERLLRERMETESLRQELKRLNRDLLSAKRSLSLLGREREQLRAILRTLETRLLSISGNASDPASPEKK
ncbi:MAG: hypothetical protein M1537_07540 [Nitrospirae bacterium]|nr:hypothetical protein [Nitrospirota bacterium]